VPQVAAWRERLANSLADDALAVKDALLDVTPLILPQGTVTTTGQPSHSSPGTVLGLTSVACTLATTASRLFAFVTDCNSSHRAPKCCGRGRDGTAPRVVGQMQDLLVPSHGRSGRYAFVGHRPPPCAQVSLADTNRFFSPRAGNMEPMFEYAARAKLSQDPTADVELATEENEADEGLFHFPHFLLSLARTIDKLIAALKVPLLLELNSVHANTNIARQPDAAPDTLVDQLFAVYSAQVHNVVKKQLTEKANKIKDELSSTSSAVRVTSSLLRWHNRWTRVTNRSPSSRLWRLGRLAADLHRLPRLARRRRQPIVDSHRDRVQRAGVRWYINSFTWLWWSHATTPIHAQPCGRAPSRQRDTGLFESARGQIRRFENRRRRFGADNQ